MTQKNDFEIEPVKIADFEPTGFSISLSRSKRSDGLLLTPTEGRCAANPDNANQPRNREWYLANVIAPMVELEEIDNGTKTKFDDRKLRYDGSILSLAATSLSNMNHLSPSFGVTHYKAFLADVNRSDEENRKLQERGIQEFGERWAYFARAPGVAVLPINQDGTIFIGERANKKYSGFLNAVAGHLTYKDELSQVDMRSEAYRELKEEFGVQQEEVSNLRFVGLYSHQAKGDLDFTFLADVAKPEEYFASGEWKSSVKERKHKDLVRLATMDEIQELLYTGKVPGSDRTLQVMYSTRGALMSVDSNEIKN